MAEKLRIALLYFSLAAAPCALTSSAHAADTVEMGLFSIQPPSGWHTEWETGRRLLSSKSGSMAPPFLIIEACSAKRDEQCPATCDLATITRSGIVQDLDLSFTKIARVDGYAEYAARRRENPAGERLYTSVRLLCGTSGFVYAALIGTASADESDQALSATLRTIKWK